MDLKLVLVVLCLIVALKTVGGAAKHADAENGPWEHGTLEGQQGKRWGAWIKSTFAIVKNTVSNVATKANDARKKLVQHHFGKNKQKKLAKDKSYIKQDQNPSTISDDIYN